MVHQERRPSAAERRSRIRAALAAVLTTMVAAPTASGQAAPDTVVREAGAPRHAGIAPLVVERTIGVTEGAAQYTFGQVEAVLPTRDGGVLVLDAPSGTAPELRQYDARGRFVRTIGRRGEGPGEFGGPSGLAQLPDGRILLLDGPTRRINVYTEAGEPAGTWPLAGVIVSTGGGDGLRVGRDGIVYARVLVRPDGERGFRNLRTAFVRLRPDGTVIDRLDAPDLPETGGSISRSTPNSRTTMSVPYAPQAVWAFSPLGGFVTGVTTRYAFELRMPARPARDGVPATWSSADGVVSVRRSTQPVGVPRAERAARRRDLEARLEGPGTLSASIPEIPATKPPYDRIEIGADGRIWISVATPSEAYDPPADAGGPSVSIGGGGAASTSRGGPPPRPRIAPVPWRQPTRFDVFEPDGTYLGQVAVPYDTRIVHRTGDVVWGVVTDEYDVPVVKRFRIGWR